MHNVTKYKNKPGGAIHVSVGAGEVEKFRQLIGDGKELHNVDGAKFVRMCIESGVLEPKAQARLDHALEFIRQANYNRDNSIFYEIDLIVKALTGCPTDTTVEFVGTTQEYDEFWNEEQDGE